MTPEQIGTLPDELLEAAFHAESETARLLTLAAERIVDLEVALVRKRTGAGE